MKIHALDALANHARAVTLQEPVQASIAPPRSRHRERLELREELGVVARALIAPRRACESREQAGAALRHAGGSRHVADAVRR